MKKAFLLLLISSSLFAQKVDTLTVFSNSMQKNIKNVVIVPNKLQDQNKVFPVLYLLHGAYGKYSDWIKKVPEIKNYANQYQMIIVCPDGDSFSWYFDSPVDSTYKYETYISKELIFEIDKNYKTMDSPKGRAITGLSMGGHGAFYLAFKHQDLFGATGSMSGGMNYIPFAHKENYELTKRLGDFDTYPENWKNNTIINMTHLVLGKNLKIYFDCGVDDFLFASNKELHQKMLAQNIPHDYTERPGGHSWNYWSNSLKYHMVFFNTFFESEN